MKLTALLTGASIALLSLPAEAETLYLTAGKFVGLQNREYAFYPAHGFNGLKAVFSSFIAHGPNNFAFHTDNGMGGIAEFPDSVFNLFYFLRGCIRSHHDDH